MARSIRGWRHSLGGLALVMSLEDTPVEGGRRLVLVAPAPGIAHAFGEWAPGPAAAGPLAREVDEYVNEISGHPLAWYSLRRVIGSLEMPILYVQDEGDAVVPLDDARNDRGGRSSEYPIPFHDGARP